ncbi:T-SNARE complex subunit syntaxin [Gigaspora margarita]|uniref:t-SNARE complex subunit syntaxin n=1 Tax=Gigaspora margarita TaxID=4874 RepID=A0A8H3XFH5_GIGMA|nr:T-SNARE complex subunit syntaxin [Gigaspora margarita]
MAHSSSSNDVGQYLDKTEAVEKSLTSLEPIFIASKRSTLIQREGSYRKERDCLINETRTLIFENKDRIKQFEYENSRLHISDPNYELHRRRHEFLRENLQMREYRKGRKQIGKANENLNIARLYSISVRKGNGSVLEYLLL